MSSRQQLAKLRSIVLKHRKAASGGQPRYSDEVKSICQSAYGKGVSVAEIADASGLCIKSIYSWINSTKEVRSSAKRGRPRSFQELTVVEGGEDVVKATKIIISLPSGARVEVS